MGLQEFKLARTPLLSKEGWLRRQENAPVP